MSETITATPISYGDEPLSWHSRGNCIGSGVSFILEKGESARNAKNLCNKPCPVKNRCLEYAIDNKEENGIWGGLSTSQRKALIAKRQLQAGQTALQGTDGDDQASQGLFSRLSALDS